MCFIEVPFLIDQPIEIAALVLPTTDYSLTVPVIVGTDAILRCRQKCEKTPEEISRMFLLHCNSHG